MVEQPVIDPEHIVVTEPVPGSEIWVHLMYVQTLDGLYAPIGLRRPLGVGPFPIVLLASGKEKAVDVVVDFLNRHLA